MGMRDESWCNGCGSSQPYTEDEEVYCGNCMEEEMDERSVKVIEYMKLHLLSLEQDSEEVNKQMDLIEDLDSDAYETLEIEDISLNGQYIATAHLLSVVSDILQVN